jgi:hypothetical protein
VGEELSASINNDMFLVIISFILFIAIAILLLSKWVRRGPTLEGACVLRAACEKPSSLSSPLTYIPILPIPPSPLPSPL